MKDKERQLELILLLAEISEVTGRLACNLEALVRKNKTEELREIDEYLDRKLNGHKLPNE